MKTNQLRFYPLMKIYAHKVLSRRPPLKHLISKSNFNNPVTQKYIIYAGADGVPCSLVSADPLLQRKFVSAHVWKVTFEHLPQPLRSYIQSFRTLGHASVKLKFGAKS